MLHLQQTKIALMLPVEMTVSVHVIFALHLPFLRARVAAIDSCVGLRLCLELNRVCEADHTALPFLRSDTSLSHPNQIDPNIASGID